MTKAKSNAIATTTDAVPATVMPAFMEGKAGQGVEEIGVEDLEIPRLVLLSAKSPQVENGDEKAGDFFHSILEESLGDSMRVIPIYVRKRVLLWRPRHEGGGILARSDDAVHWVPPNGKFTVHPVKDMMRIEETWETKPTVRESGLTEWGSSLKDDPDSAPAATRMLEVIVLFPDRLELGPAVFTFQRGTQKDGALFAGKLKASSVPIYGRTVQLTSDKRPNKAGQVYEFPKLTSTGFVEDEALFGQAETLYGQMKESGYSVKDEESLQDDSAGEPGTVETPEGAPEI